MPLFPPKMRRLISCNSQSAQNYLDSYYTGVKEHKIVSKLQSLTSNWNVVPQKERSKALDSISHQLQRITTNAENSEQDQ